MLGEIGIFASGYDRYLFGGEYSTYCTRIVHAISAVYSQLSM